MKKLFLLLTAVLMAVVCALAQNRAISGTVISGDDQEPLAGVTVMPVGGGQGTATDIDGNFTINLPANITKLTFSYVGMEPQTLEAKNGMQVVLSSNATNLDEVMVVAYGTAKKSAYTGSASVIKADEIEGRMVTDAVSALSGTMAGVQVQNTSGQPGTSPTVRIRGIGSIFGSSAPLYVVDGMPFDGDIATLNTMDVESMTVLKDAAAAALYGARGANGVILITTKKGKEGDAKITLDARWGANSRQIKGYDVITDPAMYYEMGYTALRNGYKYTLGKSDYESSILANNDLISAFGREYNIWNVPAGQLLVGLNGKLNPNATLGRVTPQGNYITPDNWYDETFITGLRQEYNLSITGGSERFNFYGSVGYLSDEGIIKGSGYKRLSSRIGAEYQAKKWLKVGASIAYNHIDMQAPSGQEDSPSISSGNAFQVVDNMAPIYPIYIRDAKGNIIYDQTSGHPVYDYGDGQYASGTYRNYMSTANPTSNFIYDKQESLMDVLDAKWYATITPIENLNVTATVGYFLDNTRHHTIDNRFYGSATILQKGGRAVQQQSRLRGLNIQVLANYRKTFADVHHTSYMVGYESYENNSESLMAYGYNLYNPNSWAINNTLNNSDRQSAGGSSGYATRGIFGRVNYDYDSRYFVEASYRRDASSNFHPDHRWGNFFSVSLGWDAAKESFLKEQTWIDMLKVKASYGQQGNDNLGLSYMPYYTDIYSIEGTETWADGNMAQKGNPELTWETSNAVNVGVDFSFFQSRLSGTLEYFLRQTSDMLYNKPVAPTNGFASIPMNIGSMRNSGIEIELTGRPIVTKDFVWELNVNGTWLKNRVLELHPDVKGQLISGMRIFKEGSSVYNFYLVDYAGVDPANGDALYWAKDENGNEYKTNNYDIANSTNRKETGNVLPTFYGGFGTSFQFYGVDLSVQFGYQLGGKMYDYGYAGLMHSGKTGKLGTNWHVDALNAWTPENTNTNIPALNSQNTYDFGSNESTALLVKSDYLSLNNITLGYTLPQRWTKKIFLETVRIYGAADNVAIWTKRKGIDPRTSFGAGSLGSYSLMRNISGGIRVVF